MSRRLIVIRHAKSEPADPRRDDRDRSLTPRGERAADAIGRWLVTGRYLPQRALCSSAVRTRRTWARIARELPEEPALAVLDALYLATPAVLLDAVRAAEAPVLAVVGHNPGLGSFAAGLLAEAPAHEAFDEFTTCATLVADFPHEIAWGAGRVVAFVVPRDLD